MQWMNIRVRHGLIFRFDFSKNCPWGLQILEGNNAKSKP